MTKAELINLIAEKGDYSKKDAEKALQLLLILYQRHFLTARRSHW